MLDQEWKLSTGSCWRSFFLFSLKKQWRNAAGSLQEQLVWCWKHSLQCLHFYFTVFKSLYLWELQKCNLEMRLSHVLPFLFVTIIGYKVFDFFVLVFVMRPLPVAHNCYLLARVKCFFFLLLCSWWVTALRSNHDLKWKDIYIEKLLKKRCVSFYMIYMIIYIYIMCFSLEE